MTESNLLKKETIREDSAIRYSVSGQISNLQKLPYKLYLTFSKFTPEQDSKFDSSIFPLVMEIAEKRGEFLAYDTYYISASGSVLYHKYQSFDERKKRWNSPAQDTNQDRINALKHSIVSLLDEDFPLEIDNPLIRKLRG